MNELIPGLRVAGTIFGIVAILHLLRVMTKVTVMINGWSLPAWINWMGFFGATFLCIWLWRMSFKGETHK